MAISCASFTRLEVRGNVQRGFVKRAEVSVKFLPQENGLGLRGVVSGPAVVHQNGGVVQVAGVHRGTGKIVANGLEHLLVPLVGHRVLLRQRGDPHGHPAQANHCAYKCVHVCSLSGPLRYEEDFKASSGLGQMSL